MSRTLLINPIGPDPPPIYFGPPYGLALIAAVLERNGKDVTCLAYERESYDEMMGSLMKELSKGYDYVGVSCQSTSRGVVYRMIDSIRKGFPDAKLIVGGPFASLMPELLSVPGQRECWGWP